MTWNPDEPFPASSALGETDGGARNLPRFLCSLLVEGPVLVLGSSEVALAAAERHDVVVVDWNHRRLIRLDACLRERGAAVRMFCRDPEHQDLGLAPRSVKNVVCLDVLERFRSDGIVLDKLHRVLAPEGRLVVRVRACPWMGTEESGTPTARHYAPDELRESLQGAGFRTLNLRYWNLLGLPSAYASKWSGRAAVCAPGVPACERPRHWWDSALDLWFQTVENRVGFPTGVSLIAVGTPHLEKVRVRREMLARGFSRQGTREAYEPTALSR